MGSSYFYLEFLIAFVHLLRTSSATNQFQNPALFALEYTLVPDASYPTQLHEVLAGYHHLLTILPDPSRICLAGDSAGATLSLSLLLHLSRQEESRLRPGFAVLISPWVTLESRKNEDTKDDYLNADVLRLYAKQYIGSIPNKTFRREEPILSPGTCRDGEWWLRAVPARGLAVFYGTEEVLATETRDLVALLQGTGVDVVERPELGGIHAWPVAKLFLSDTGQARLKGLRDMVELIGERMV
ncbi:MAG: hypothetical protein M1816_004281 [Peltula sp. TS41687]|nr:MAG: hypothetical protein M1816_004281 [Peltula sp. TS41687]